MSGPFAFLGGPLPLDLVLEHCISILFFGFFGAGYSHPHTLQPILLIHIHNLVVRVIAP